MKKEDFVLLGTFATESEVRALVGFLRKINIKAFYLPIGTGGVMLARGTSGGPTAVYVLSKDYLRAKEYFN